MTTTGPRGARAIGADLSARKLAFVEAPVVGSLRAAAEGTLTTLVGGEPDSVEQAMPVLQAWSAPGRVVHMGGVGTANAAKLVSVVAQAVAIEGVGEAMRLGRDTGLDRARLMEALRVGVFGTLVSAKEDVLLSQVTDDADYPVDMFVAEMSLALYEAAAALPAAEAAYLQARLAASQGRGAHDVAEIALRREALPRPGSEDLAPAPGAPQAP
jgi:3-hydroxyisobutyrate dehydrogenase-like beta-hydroxyacid dehydrogenase